MNDIRNLLARVAAGEANLRRDEFLAPCVAGGAIRVRVQGLVCTFRALPADREGWGVFRALDPARAEWTDDAPLPQIEDWLKRLPALRMRLVHRLQGRTWLAFPANESDMRQKLGEVAPRPVFLVDEAARFDLVVTRFDGASLWHEAVDRRADPRDAERLESSLQGDDVPAFKGITPEMVTARAIAWQQTAKGRAAREKRLEEARLRDALRLGGAALNSHHDRGDHWLVEWTSRSGEAQTSLIAKRDLTVISAGICLSGLDRTFDLQSLVNVVEGSE